MALQLATSVLLTPSLQRILHVQWASLLYWGSMPDSLMAVHSVWLHATASARLRL